MNTGGGNNLGTLELERPDGPEEQTGGAKFTFSILLRLLRHLRRGGTRKGACGWAGVRFSDLAGRMERDNRLAGAVERAESRGLAGDERRLDRRVREGDREALIFRMRSVYGYGGSRTKEGAEVTIERKNGEFAEVERSMRALGEGARNELVRAYREALAG